MYEWGARGVLLELTRNEETLLAGMAPMAGGEKSSTLTLLLMGTMIASRSGALELIKL